MIGQAEIQTDAGRARVRRYGGAVAGVMVYIAYFLIMTLFNAHHPRLPLLAWLGIGLFSTVGYLLILVYAIRLLCRLQLPARVQAKLMGGSLVLFLALNPMVWEVVGRLAHGERLLAIINTLTTPTVSPALDMVLDVVGPFFLILTGVFLGQLVAGLIREQALLVPVAIVSGLIDLWGVYWGPVSIMSAAAPAAVTGMATAATAAATVPEEVKAQLPQQLLFMANIAPPDNIGIGDFVFLAFFLTCAYRLGFSARRTMWGIFGGLLLASVVIALDGQWLFGHKVVVEYLPGLLFICGGVLLANLRAWKLTRQEWLMTGTLLLVFGSLTGTAIVRAEMNKPRHETAQYVLQAPTAQDALVQALAKLPQVKSAVPDRVVPYYEVFVFANEPAGPRVVQWQLLAIGLRQHPTLRTSWRFDVIGGLRATSAGTWEVKQLAERPLDVGKLLGKSMDDNAQLAWMHELQGVPAQAAQVLEQAAEFGRELPGGKYFGVELTRERAYLLGADGSRVRELAYR